MNVRLEGRPLVTPHRDKNAALHDDVSTLLVDRKAEAENADEGTVEVVNPFDHKQLHPQEAKSFSVLMEQLTYLFEKLESLHKAHSYAS